MRVVLPMGGSGKRFRAAGYTLPKPLILAGKKPLLDWALGSLAQLGPVHYECLMSEEVASHPSLEGCCPLGCWHILPTTTTGPLQTVLSAQDCLHTEEELLICDCDSFLDPYELRDAIEVFRAVKATGGVTIRRTTDPNCSFAEINSEWWVKSTREKDPYTPWSTTGPYWFASGQQFLNAALKAAHSQETTISPVYNFLEGKTKAVPIATFHHLGTPEELETFVKSTS